MDPFTPNAARTISDLEIGFLNMNIPATAFRNCSPTQIQRQEELNTLLPASFCPVLASHGSSMYVEPLCRNVIHWVDFLEGRPLQRKSWAAMTKPDVYGVLRVALPVLSLDNPHGELHRSLYFRDDHTPVLIAPRGGTQATNADKRRNDASFICLIMVAVMNRMGSARFMDRNSYRLIREVFGSRVPIHFTALRDFLLNGDYLVYPIKYAVKPPFLGDIAEMENYIRKSYEYYFSLRTEHIYLLDEAWDGLRWEDDVENLEDGSVITEFYHHKPNNPNIRLPDYRTPAHFLMFGRHIIIHLEKELHKGKREDEVAEELDIQLNFVFKLFKANLYVLGSLPMQAKNYLLTVIPMKKA